jgi:LAGLIDADG DNA endonuclease family protein
MTDSDGNFHISLCGVYGLNGSVNKGRVICSFSLKQRMIDKSTGLSCIPFMTEIANLFECKINYKAINEIVFVVQANNKHYLVKSYFEKFPLMSSKYLDYLCFLQSLKFLSKRLIYKEIIEIQDIKNSMNSKRTYYN